MMHALRIAVTFGDCNGIGLECFVKALQQWSDPLVHFTLYAHPVTLAESLCIYTHNATFDGSVLRIGDHVVSVIPCDAYAAPHPGEVQADAGAHAIASLTLAIDATRAGHADAIVTLPVSKEANTAAGWTFPGQTEMLAHACGQTPHMMLCSGSLRVALATIHLPLRSVADALTVHGIHDAIRVLDRTLRTDHRIDQPRLAVLGLNPHAGEHGQFGGEEIDVIHPAILRALDDGINVDGPWPADGFFAFGSYQHYDGILAMYHDQGLIPLKLIARGGGVNCTAGLSIVRTSPDHGTAFALAGKDRADATSTIEAIQMAVQIARNRKA